MSEKRRIVLNTLANGVAQFAQMLSALVFMPFLVRAFDTTNYGVYLLASSVASYAVLLDLGVGTSLIKLTAGSVARGDHAEEGRVVSSALLFYLGVGVVTAAILGTLSLNTASIFHIDRESARLLSNLFGVAAVWQLWVWPATTATAVLMGHQRYTQTALTSLLTVGLTIAATLAVLATHEGPLWLLVGTTAASFVGSVAQIVLARRALGPTRVSLRTVDGSSLRTIFNFAWAVFVLQLCGIILYQQTDRLVLGVFVGATAVALYEAAGKFQGLVSQLTTFSVSAVMPMASHLDAQGRQESLRQLFLRGTKYSLMLLLPVVTVLIVIARPLLLVWLGPQFAAFALAAQILISHQLLTSGTAVGDSMMTGVGLMPKRVPYAVGVALLNLAISLALVQRFGIMGVVLGTAIPYFIDFPFHVRLILRGLDIPAGRWLRETVLPTYPMLLLPALISWGLLSTKLSASFAGMAAIGISSVGAYWVAVYALGFTASERSEFRGGLAAVWARMTGRSSEQGSGDTTE